MPSCEKNTRRQRGKSRNGCRQCKARRIKCDETLPACLNCIQRNDECPGYAKPLRWSHKHEKAPASQFEGRINAAETDASGSRPSIIIPASSSGTVSSEQSAVQSTWEAPAEALADFSRATDLVASDMANSFDQSMDVWQAIDMLPSAHNMSSTRTKESVSGIPPALVDLPTTLIELWFKHVCPAWSTFDSDVNYNRIIAASSWSTSEPVFHTMQSMAATYLAECMPQVKRQLQSMTGKAESSIREAVQELKFSGKRQVETSIVFATFGIGTSMHWTDGEICHSWLDLASELLDMWTSKRTVLETFFHAYFKQAIMYWRMLMCIASDTEHERVERRRAQHHKLSQSLVPAAATNLARLSSHVDFSQDFQGTRPNSWCGVSSEAIDLFGQVVALCRSAIVERKYLNLPAEDVSAIAKELEMELQSLDIQSPLLEDDMLGFSTHTGDDLTPTLHLVQTAEAYRQAALLQLYLTFSGLHSSATSNGGTVRGPPSKSPTTKSTPMAPSLLALRLTNILEQVPAESGSRSIHPVLYLSAAAGLKFDSETAVDLEAVQKESFEIAAARRFVLTRLSILQYTLPSKPIICVLDLVKKIWDRYDNAGDSTKVHWIDVMMESGLQTLFG